MRDREDPSEVKAEPGASMSPYDMRWPTPDVFTANWRVLASGSPKGANRKARAAMRSQKGGEGWRKKAWARGMRKAKQRARAS